MHLTPVKVRELSEIITITPTVINAIRSEKNTSSTITALVFLVNLVFLFTILITGSIELAIKKPIKNGM